MHPRLSAVSAPSRIPPLSAPGAPLPRIFRRIKPSSRPLLSLCYLRNTSCEQHHPTGQPSPTPPPPSGTPTVVTKHHPLEECSGAAEPAARLPCRTCRRRVAPRRMRGRGSAASAAVALPCCTTEACVRIKAPDCNTGVEGRAMRSSSVQCDAAALLLKFGARGACRSARLLTPPLSALLWACRPTLMWGMER